jgi:hypothetical protein
MRAATEDDNELAWDQKVADSLASELVDNLRAGEAVDLWLPEDVEDLAAWKAESIVDEPPAVNMRVLDLYYQSLRDQLGEQEFDRIYAAEVASRDAKPPTYN